MFRTILAFVLTTFVLAAFPGVASARFGNDGSSRKERAATAIWPSERPYHVDLGPVCKSRVPVLVRNPHRGPANIWVVNINCDPPGPDRRWFW